MRPQSSEGDRFGGAPGEIPRGTAHPGLLKAPAWQEHALLLASNFHRWTGRDLVPDWRTDAELAITLFDATPVILSHGTETDPILNFGNRRALELWEMSWDEFTSTPSRLTAEPVNRETRARLLAEVKARGFIDDYSGVRISKTGRRFEVKQAIVWNLFDGSGSYRGQAACFSNFEFLAR